MFEGLPEDTTYAELLEFLRRDLQLDLSVDALADTWPPGGWKTWSPTWLGSLTAPSVGNGSIAARYFKINKLCFIRITMVFGSTTSGGTGTLSFGNLPFISAATPEQEMNCKLYTPSTGTNWMGPAYLVSLGTTISPEFPLINNRSDLSNWVCAPSGGGAGAGVPLISSAYNVQTNGNFEIWGFYETAV